MRKATKAKIYMAIYFALLPFLILVAGATLAGYAVGSWRGAIAFLISYWVCGVLLAIRNTWNTYRKQRGLIHV